SLRGALPEPGGGRARVSSLLAQLLGGRPVPQDAPAVRGRGAAPFGAHRRIAGVPPRRRGGLGAGRGEWGAPPEREPRRSAAPWRDPGSLPAAEAGQPFTEPTVKPAMNRSTKKL